ncbi:MAG: hypothetical protein F4Y45_05425 [Acidobacteria bacterium]|nr:hypothetical protein [Acidobacteriota bacterium]
MHRISIRGRDAFQARGIVRHRLPETAVCGDGRPGVDVRGRSHTLRINYRTSHQIRRQADRLLHRRGPLHVLRDDDVRTAFDDTLIELVEATPIIVFGVVIDKATHGRIPVHLEEWDVLRVEQSGAEDADGTFPERLIAVATAKYNRQRYDGRISVVIWERLVYLK